MAAIIGTVLSAVLVPLLAWLFSGSTKTVVQRVDGLKDLDRDTLSGTGDLKLPNV
jgi:predicted Na+-dependent transporter